MRRVLAIAAVVAVVVLLLLLRCRCREEPPPPDAPRAAAEPELSALPIDPDVPMPDRDLSTSARAPAGEPVKVMIDARADVFSAGLPEADAARGGKLPPHVELPPGAHWITFPRVAGKAGCQHDEAYGADGGPCAGGATDLQSAGGIAGIVAAERSLFLVGVFLADQRPEVAPARLDFSATARGVAFTELSPALAQVFFIGDGRSGTGDGAVQRFAIPAGATRLFLGYADGPAFTGEPGSYADNTGGLNATVVAKE